MKHLRVALLTLLACATASKPAPTPAKDSPSPPPVPARVEATTVREVPTIMVKRGALVFSDDFSNPDSTRKSWRIHKNTQFEFTGGVLRARTQKRDGDQHTGRFMRDMAFQDGVIQISFRVAEAGSSVWLGFDQKKEHVASTKPEADGSLQVALNSGWGSTSKTEVLGARPLPAMEPGRWHTLLAEVRGDEILAQLDGVVVRGQHAGVSRKKDFFRLVLVGKGWVELDDVRVWEALPDESWPSRRAALALNPG